MSCLEELSSSVVHLYVFLYGIVHAIRIASHVFLHLGKLVVFEVLLFGSSSLVENLDYINAVVAALTSLLRATALTFGSISPRPGSEKLEKLMLVSVSVLAPNF